LLGGPQAGASPAAAAGEMRIQMAIVHPEIVVVENAMTMDTNALILTVSSCVSAVTEQTKPIDAQGCVLCGSWGCK